MGESGASRSGELPAGTELGSYDLEEVIGRGGAGVVYRARHRTLHRDFAVKVVRASDALDARTAYRLVREARTVCGLRHDHIIDVTDMGHTPDGLVYVVMELLLGESLAERLEREREGEAPRIPDDEVRRIFREATDGVAYAHEQGVIHRDLKPANLFLARRGERATTKVLDFGLSKVVSSEPTMKLTRTGQVLGTPLYMAPEQSRGLEVDERADVYSMGVVMYEALAGRPPFQAETFYEAVLAHATETPPPLEELRSDLPESVRRLVHQCLAKEPDARPPSMRALHEQWRAAWDGEPVAIAAGAEPDPGHAVPTALPEVEAEAEARPPESGAGVGRAGVVGAVVGVVAFGLALGLWQLGRPTVEEPAPPGAMVSASRASAPTEEPSIAAEPDEPVDPAVPDEPVDPAVPDEPAETVVVVESVPNGARVYRDGERVGTTPLELTLAEGERASLVLRRRGRRSVSIEIDASEPVRSVRLPPRPAEVEVEGPPPLAPYYDDRE